jgi:hypothetical protein
MPSFSLSSVARATSEHFSLSLRARHYLVVGSQSRTYHVKARFPEAVDVILASDLVITLSGVVDGVNISSQDILASAATSHLVHYLKTVRKFCTCRNRIDECHHLECGSSRTRYYFRRLR